ncbi:hypothetical protein [Phenylobacterium sp.]|uniref:hypothetical protein n=1 Tax=Phenylobacterium sp. TaxID=1871053 RepID=UPI003919DD90
MFISIQGSAQAKAGSAPTSLLKLVAGEFAGRVAVLWPEPHGGFLTASAQRRHLVCLGFAVGADVQALAAAIMGARLRHVVSAVVGTPPAGLERVLGRLGEIAWDAEAYRLLLTLLARPAPAKVLRHAEAVDVGLVRRLAGLPAPMEDAVRLARELTPEGLAVLCEAHEALRFRDGAGAAEEAAGRWAKAGSVRALFAAVRDDLTPEPGAPPHPGTARLRPLATKAALRDAARRYRNCLADRMPHAASGWSAFYEWAGPPGAVVEVARDHVFGWRPEEARLAGNRPVPEPLRDEIMADLALMGVHVGRSGWQLDRLLREDVGRGYRFWPVEAEVAEAFGEG